MIKKKVKPAIAGKKSSTSKAKTTTDILDIPAELKGKLPVGKTKTIQVRSMNNSKKTLGIVERQFDKVTEARDYLIALSSLDEKAFKEKLQASRDGRVATINRLDIELNYNIRDIMANEEPDELLPEIKDFGSPTLKTQYTTPPTQSPEKADKPAVTATPKTKATSNGHAVVLKEICKALGIDASKARIKLRRLDKDKKLPPEVEGGRWQWSKDDAEKVKALLGGK